MKEIVESISKIPAEIFSPFKILIIGYIILIAMGKIQTNNSCFLSVMIPLVILEIFHNDCLRIILNRFGKWVFSRANKK